MLRLERVTKRYGDVTVLDDVSFTLRRGEIHGLLGLNGAGKSTLVKLLSGAIIPTSGTIELDETPVTFTPAEAIRRGIITVSQEVDDALYLDLPIYENVVPWQAVERIRPRELKQRAATYLERVGLEIDVTEPVGRFPLSVKQRVLIARRSRVMRPTSCSTNRRPPCRRKMRRHCSRYCSRSQRKVSAFFSSRIGRTNCRASPRRRRSSGMAVSPMKGRFRRCQNGISIRI
ncbi:ATP-binding cassette domain-containing protein [Exiguobacterium sp. AM39-5BH]|uniref:ATP-binding cassette domain-containing protein n=1 Tax=Exiguobacterium sp. AM39-5BH TaxID=2292355 RepID=UPI000FE26E02|nr:ATP-binding cassette domain-containing protein [Exiguobacterium sp. AM39-5BH]RHB48879.1 sugar ABC transporter ATP-binding protein [Exiguobacterium sp. AM39-5BH]